MSAIDEVKQRTDIVDVVSQYTALKKAGRNLTALCPFHSEKHPSFFVYPEQQSWHCFGACNTGGDVLSFIMKKEGLDFGEALKLLAQRAGVILPARMEREGGKEEKEELYQVNEAAALYFNNLLLNSPAAEKARSYVESRGFTPKTVADFQLGFSLLSLGDFSLQFFVALSKIMRAVCNQVLEMITVLSQFILGALAHQRFDKGQA